MKPHLFAAPKGGYWLSLAAALLCAVVSGRAYGNGLPDLESSLTAWALEYHGTQLRIDPNYFGSDQCAWDTGSFGPPDLIIEDEGGGECTLLWMVPGMTSWATQDVYSSTDMQNCLLSAGFGFYAAPTAVTSGTVSLDANDASNLQALTQVGYWIFGAFIMIPIVLKVRLY